MPRKMRELDMELEREDFKRTRAKGSHRKWLHPKAKVTISGKPGDDAKHYQEEHVKAARRHPRS